MSESCNAAAQLSELGPYRLATRPSRSELAIGDGLGKEGVID